jgi:2,3-diketo-5-methylthio-1-phosphopentane phosphatase
MSSNIVVFSDFDGTITKVDVGNLIFRTFAGDAIFPMIQSWRKNEISSKELLTRECELVNLNNIDELISLIDKQEIDDNFIQFANFCYEKKIDIFIVSDGMDIYIDKILSKNKIDYIPFFANKFGFKSENNKVLFQPEFPHTDSECLKCGNCKRNHLLYNSFDDDIIVYIGDGYSDRCPVEYADVVFAKRELASYCTSAKIPFIEFLNFNDIIKKMELIVGRKRNKKRRQAELKRNEVFIQG